MEDEDICDVGVRLIDVKLKMDFSLQMMCKYQHLSDSLEEYRMSSENNCLKQIYDLLILA